MTSGTLVLGSLMTMAEGLAYALVAYRLTARVPLPAGREAIQFYTLFWYTIGINKFLAGAASFAAAYGAVQLDHYVALTFVNVLIFSVSLWALLYYLLYVRLGHARFLFPLTALYVGYYVLLTSNLVALHPASIQLGEWRTALRYEESTPPWVGLLVLGVMVLPQTVATLAYVALYRRAQTRAIRYRIPLVAWSILAWSASVFLVALPGFADNGWMQLTSRLVGLSAAAAALLAYAPPAGVRRRLGEGAGSDG